MISHKDTNNVAVYVGIRSLPKYASLSAAVTKQSLQLPRLSWYGTSITQPLLLLLLHTVGTEEEQPPAPARLAAASAAAAASRSRLVVLAVLVILVCQDAHCPTPFEINQLAFAQSAAEGKAF